MAVVDDGLGSLGEYRAEARRRLNQLYRQFRVLNSLTYLRATNLKNNRSILFTFLCSCGISEAVDVVLNQL